MHTHFGERRSHVRTFEMIQTDTLRRRMQRAIDDLIAALDALDGDADFEAANDDEPSLGWHGCGRGAAGRLDGPAMDTGADDREHDDADDEPSLGAAEHHPGGGRGWTPFLRRDRDGSQAAWARSGSDDREHDDADDEDGGDSEPSLGGADDDRELDDAEVASC